MTHSKARAKRTGNAGKVGPATRELAGGDETLIRLADAPSLVTPEQDESASRNSVVASSAQIAGAFNAPVAGPSNSLAADYRVLAMLAFVGTALGALTLQGFTGGLLAGLLAAAGIGLLLSQHYRRRDAGGTEATLPAAEAKLVQRLEAEVDAAWELRENEEQLESLTDAFGDLVVVRSPSGAILTTNAQFREAFPVGGAHAGLQFKDLLAQAGNDLEGRELIVNGLEMKVGKGAAARWFRWAETSLHYGHGRVAVRTVARDITAHKQVESALEAARRKAETANLAKSRFLATVSHEMRTPLNGILGMADLLSDTALTPEQRTYREAIHTSGTALLQLIEDLLDLTLIEAGRFEIRPEDFDPARLTQDVVELLSARAQAKGIDLAAIIDARMPLMLRGDAGRLRQILVNLVGNAIKFTEHGGVLVTARHDGTSLCVEIRDTGPGLTKADIGRIFNEFEQADSATTRRHGGAGLGLSISQGLARRLGGAIDVESVPGKGSTFSITLPLPVRKSAVAEAVGIPGSAVSHVATARVALVTKRLMHAEAVAQTVKDAGGSCECFPTLGQAQKALRHGSADGTPFTDVMVDARALRQADTALQRLRAAAGKRIAATVLVTPQDRPALAGWMASGFDAFLVLPIRRASLLRVLSGASPAVGQTAENDGFASLPQPILAKGELLPRHKVLLAEDNPINALLARTVLQRAGQDVTLCGTGRDAVEAFREARRKKSPFELVLMDLHMPVMDGEAAIRAIRRMEKKSGAAPCRILTLSADSQSESRQMALGAGADGYLTKPLDPRKLIGIIRAIPAGEKPSSQ